MTAKPVQTENSAYETGARKYPAAAPQTDDIDTHAGMPTANPFGITLPEDETNEKTRQSDNVDQRTASPATPQHSKHHKAPKSGRQAGAHVKH